MGTSHVGVCYVCLNVKWYVECLIWWLLR